MVAVLLAAPRVAAGGLQVTARVGGHPHVGPGRRDGERANAGQHVGVVDGRAREVIDVVKAPLAATADARLVVETEDQPRGSSGGVGHGSAIPSGTRVEPRRNLLEGLRLTIRVGGRRVKVVRVSRRSTVRAKGQGKPLPAADEASLRVLEISGERPKRRGPRPVLGGWRRWTWLVLSIAGLTAFGLSVSGTKGSPLAKLQDGLHMFPSGFPGADVNNEKARVIAARDLAAVVSLSVTLRVLAGLYTRLGSEMRSRRRHDHSVIVGLGDKGVRIGRALRDQGAKVTGLELQSNGDGAADLRRRGALVLQGDATKTEILHIAWVGRAARVVCACHDDRMNAEIALRVASEVERYAPKHRRVVDVHVHLSDRDLAHTLEGPALGLGAVRLQFFNIYELWARALVAASAIEPDSDSDAPFVAVIGAGPIGRAVLVAVGRMWHECPAAARPRVSLIDHRAAAALGRAYGPIPRAAVCGRLHSRRRRRCRSWFG